MSIAWHGAGTEGTPGVLLRLPHTSSCVCLGSDSRCHPRLCSCCTRPRHDTASSCGCYCNCPKKDAHQRLASVAEAQGQPGVGDQVGQAVRAAQQVLLGVGRKALLRPVDRGVQGERRCAVGLVLRCKRYQHPTDRGTRARGLLRACLRRFCSALTSFFWRFWKALLSLQGVRPEMLASE